MRSVDTDADSLIDYEEFANRFQVVFTNVKAKQQEQGKPGTLQRRPSDPNITLDWSGLDDTTQAALQRLGRLMLTSTTVHEAFAKFDPDGTKHVSVDDFARALRAVDDQLRCVPPPYPLSAAGCVLTSHPSSQRGGRRASRACRGRQPVGQRQLERV